MYGIYMKSMNTYYSLLLLPFVVCISYTAEPPHKNNALASLIIGTVTGMCEPLINGPLITVKNKIQMGIPVNSARPKELWNGAATAAGFMGIITGIQTGLDAVLQPSITNNIARSLVAGTLSAGIIVHPAELVIARQHALNCNTKTALADIKKHGLASIKRGLPCTAAREALFVAGYCGLATDVSDYYKSHGISQTKAQLFGSLTSAFVAMTISHPFDTIKTMLIKDLGAQQYKSTYHLLQQLSIKDMYKGYTPRLARGVLAIVWLSFSTQWCKKKLL